MPDGGLIDYDGLIPNNVGLAEDLRVRKALETWHPGYIDWWKSMGPEGFQESPVYLRTAVGVGSEGWAKFGFVKNAGVPLGHPAGAPGGGPDYSVWCPQGRACLAGSPWRISAPCCGGCW